jgi:hypothetical protein
VNTEYRAYFAKVFELQDRIVSVHPCLSRLYPIVLANGNELEVYQPDRSGRCYEFLTRVQVPMALPDKVRAAFPLENLDCMMACVVTSDAFSTIDGYVDIFHEFVHCHQFEECEIELKQSLGVAVEALAAKDYMWELNYPFPYQDRRVRDAYSDLVGTLRSASKGADACAHRGETRAVAGCVEDEQRSNADPAAAENADYQTVSEYRKAVRDLVDTHSFEYMVWQEWKEGFARFIENGIRASLGLPLNLAGDLADDSSLFTRVSFYAGGAMLIEFLEGVRPETAKDLKRLFDELIEMGSSRT